MILSPPIFFFFSLRRAKEPWRRKEEQRPYLGVNPAVILACTNPPATDVLRQRL